MSENLFFRWIWRFNALGLAIALILWGLAFGPVMFWSGSLETIGVAPSSKLPALDDASNSLELVRVVDGTSAAIFSYGTKPEYSRGAGSFSQPAMRQVVNYLFYDTKDGSARWLFPDNKQVIQTLSFVLDDGSASDFEVTLPILGPAGTLGDAGSANPKRALRALIFDVVPQGSTSTGSRSYQVYASRPDGTEVTKLINSADEIVTFAPLDANTIVISYRRAGRSFATTFALSSFKPLLEKDLTALVPK